MNVINEGDWCPVCGLGILQTKISKSLYTQNDKRDTIPLRFQKCDRCGTEIAGTKDIEFNKRAVAALIIMD